MASVMCPRLHHRGWAGSGAWSTLLALFLLLASAAASASDSPAEAERVLERRVKAAFIYRFTEFTVWPEAAYARPDAPFSIVVVGPESYSEELRQIVAGRTIGTRPIQVQRAAELQGLAAAQIVFVADRERQRIPQIVRAAPRHALIVTESDGALDHGSVINFIIVDGRVRFQIALDAAERRSLKLSSRLLAVAHSVRPSGVR